MGAVFLSTPSGWRATECRFLRSARYADFYPRPPGGGRLQDGSGMVSQIIFLSTPSGWRATRRKAGATAVCAGFLSTPSGWRATSNVVAFLIENKISIHALRVEGDAIQVVVCVAVDLFLSTPSGWRATAFGRVADTCAGNFYPRPPGGGRRSSARSARLQGRFLSTPSGWRATKTPCSQLSSPKNFYPRPPGGGRPLDSIRHLLTPSISIHALRVEGDTSST